MDTERFDWTIVGHNLRWRRNALGLTQDDVAARSGVSTRTLSLAELGKPIRVSTLGRICDALETPVSGIDKYLRIANPKRTDQPFVHSDASEILWGSFLDRRRQVPADNFELIQSAEERRRLGRAGFVDAFLGGYGFIMPEGPGVLYIEVYREFEFCSPLYRHQILICLRGEVRVSLAGEVSNLRERSAIGYDLETRPVLAPAQSIGPDDLPPLLLLSAGTRVGKVEIA